MSQCLDGGPSECGSHASVGRKRHSRQKGSRIIENEKIVGPERIAVEASLIEEGARRKVVLVEEVLDQPEHLHVLGDLIGAVKVNQPIGWHLWVLVGIIMDEILGAENEEVATKFPRIRDLVLGRH